jgi:hypothetical protein
MQRLQVLRRAQRLLPAGLQVIGLLPAMPDRWEASALAGVRLGRSPRGGVLGLRLRPLCSGLPGTAADAAVPGIPVDRAGYGPWRTLARSQGLYWVEAACGGRAMLLDAPQARAWLLWQDQEVRTWCPY